MAEPKTWPRRLVDLRNATAVLLQREGKGGDALIQATTAWKKFRRAMGKKEE